MRIKCYVNGDLVVVSDNFYSKQVAEGEYTPKNSPCSFVRIFTFKSVACTMYLDDVSCYVTSDTYTPATDADTKVIYNVERGGAILPEEPEAPTENETPANA